MTSKVHTPGPWFSSALLTADDGWTFCSVGPFEVTGDADHVEDTIAEVSGINHDALSNARLIAASPDMLDALKHAHALLADARAHYNPEHCPLCKSIEQAILKAEGR